MSSKVLGRKVDMFRTVVDVSIDVKPRQAYMPKDMNAEAFVTDMGINLIRKDREGKAYEFLVPYANVSVIRLEAEEVKVDRRLQQKSLAV